MTQLSITELLNSGSYWSAIATEVELAVQFDEPRHGLQAIGKQMKPAKGKRKRQDQDETQTHWDRSEFWYDTSK